MTSRFNNLTALRKAILKNKEVTPEGLYDLSQWLVYLAALKAGQKAKSLKKKK